MEKVAGAVSGFSCPTMTKKKEKRHEENARLCQWNSLQTPIVTKFPNKGKEGRARGYCETSSETSSEGHKRETAKACM